MKTIYLYLDSAALRPLVFAGRGLSDEEARALDVIRLELESGNAALAVSFAHRAELRKWKNRAARAVVSRLLKLAKASAPRKTPEIARHAFALWDAGMEIADALHVAAAASLSVDALVTVDGGLLEVARQQPKLCGVRVCKPSDYVLGKSHEKTGGKKDKA